MRPLAGASGPIVVVLPHFPGQPPVHGERLPHRLRREVEVALGRLPERHAHACDLAQARVAPLVAVRAERRDDPAEDQRLGRIVLADEQRPARAGDEELDVRDRLVAQVALGLERRDAVIRADVLVRRPAEGRAGQGREEAT